MTNDDVDVFFSSFVRIVAKTKKQESERKKSVFGFRSGFIPPVYLNSHSTMLNKWALVTCFVRKQEKNRVAHAFLEFFP